MLISWVFFSKVWHVDWFKTRFANRFANDPYRLMMEYTAFDFKSFGLDKAVNNLEDLYIWSFIDCEFHFTSF